MELKPLIHLEQAVRPGAARYFATVGLELPQTLAEDTKCEGDGCCAGVLPEERSPWTWHIAAVAHVRTQLESHNTGDISTSFLSLLHFVKLDLGHSLNVKFTLI